MRTDARQGECVSLRSADTADLPAVLALLQRSDLPTAGVSEALPHFLVAESGERIVGVAGLEIYHQSALLRSVAVDERWRGTGVGRALIDRALSITRQRGIHDVFLLTTTAEEYFPRFGFVCIGRDAVTQEVQTSAEFQGACPASAVVMRKSLVPQEGLGSRAVDRS